MSERLLRDRDVAAVPGTTPGVAVSAEVSELVRELMRKDEERAAIMRRLEIVLGMQPCTALRKSRAGSREEFARRCGLGG